MSNIEIYLIKMRKRKKRKENKEMNNNFRSS